MYLIQSERQRRQRLLRELFRNALSIAVLKQALVANGGSSPAAAPEARKEPLPPYYLG